jgi:hypothetical protein
MTAHGSIPLARLYGFPLRTFLQINVALGIEHMQMDYRMQSLRTVVAFTTCSRPDYIALFVDKGKEFVVIVVHEMRRLSL